MSEQEAFQAEANKQGMAVARAMNNLGDDLNGYEEEGILAAFGKRWFDDDLDLPTTLRALVFVLKRREGLTHEDAFETVKNMKNREVRDIVLAFDDDEVFPDAPETERGKDDSPTAPPPVS